MKKLIFSTLVLSLFVIGANAQVSTPEAESPKPAESPTVRLLPDGTPSDNCTGFPDGNYADCCYEHDLAYFKGGSWKERWRADKQLSKCVAAKGGTKNKIAAPLMWLGVRAFGAPFIPTSARWGFGKNRTAKPASKPVTEAEIK